MILLNLPICRKPTWTLPGSVFMVLQDSGDTVWSLSFALITSIRENQKWKWKLNGNLGLLKGVFVINYIGFYQQPKLNFHGEMRCRRPLLREVAEQHRRPRLVKSSMLADLCPSSPHKMDSVGFRASGLGFKNCASECWNLSDTYDDSVAEDGPAPLHAGCQKCNLHLSTRLDT